MGIIPFMDVRCDHCKTEYTLDETLVSTGGTSVRCTKCGHVFKAYRAGGGADEWYVRNSRGETRSITRLNTLQKLISEGRVTSEDRISKKNGPWKRIADIPELKPFFAEGALSAGVLKSDKSEIQATIRQTSPVAKGKRGRMDTLDEPFVHDSTPKAVPKAVPVSTPKTGEEASAKTTLKPKPVAFENRRTHRITTPPLATPIQTADTRIAPHTSDIQTADTRIVPPKPDAPTLSSDLARGATIQLESMVEADEAYAPTLKTNQRAVVKAVKKAAKPEPPIEPEEGPDFSQIPATDDDGVRWGREERFDTAEPAWTEKSSGLLPYEAGDSDLPPPRRKHNRWVIVMAVFFVVGGGFLFINLFPSVAKRVRSAVNSVVGSSESERYQKFFERGQESFLLDADIAYRQADREFQKVLALEENHPPTLAALGQMYSVWAQYLKDATLDEAADAAPAEGEADTGPSKEAERLRGEFDEKFKEAAQWAKQAVAADPSLKEAQLAMADVQRLEGKLDAAEAHLAKAMAEGADAETEYVAVLIDIDRGKPTDGLVDRLDKVIAVKPMIRALYRQARILASAESYKPAEAALSKLFELNSAHGPARKLFERIKDQKPVWLRPESPSEASPTPDAEPAVKEKKKAGEPAPPKKTEGPVASPDRSAKEPPKSLDGLLNKAVKLQSSGNCKKAEPLFGKVLERSPSNVEALTGLGTCYSKRGSSGRAIAQYRRALSQNANYGPALIGLADTYKRTGNTGQALKYYQQYLDTNPSGRQAGTAQRSIAALKAARGPVEDSPEDSPEKSPGGSPAEASDEGSPAGGEAPPESPSAPAAADETPGVIITGPEDE